MAGLLGWAIALTMFVIGVSIGEVDQTQLERACRDHEGVQQILPTTWVAIEGANTVVCRDGVVRRVS